MYHWNLEKLYKDFNEEFETDKTTLKSMIQELTDLSAQLKDLPTLENWLKLYAETQVVAKNLSSYAHLRGTTDASDAKPMTEYGQIMAILAGQSTASTRFQKFVIDNSDSFDTWCETSDLIKEHEFVLKEIIQKGKYLLNEEVENTIGELQLNASSNWSKLHGSLTSVSTINFNDKKETLSSLRNFAYSDNKEIRKQAFEKELELCSTIDEPIAFALNSIKGEVNTINALRGFNSPIEKTLSDSRMSQETLDALMGAMQEYLPMFRKYLNHKATLLGHEKGLPWYDLFAPLDIGEVKKYTVEEAMTMIITSFRTFSDDLADMTQAAWDDEWIDFLPYEGKRDGAFCSNQSQIKQSYILSNFDGSISSIVTLAHELGHAYHGLMIQDLSPLNTRYTMPVAETASTFCENILMNAIMKTATKSEQLLILENAISDSTQIIVDIMSRYQFEAEVFERRNNEFLNAENLKEIMLKAQKNTYGDALDQDQLHPYMWLVKGHYYSGGLSFYNFPYAFGGLFALGLYSEYEKTGASFVPKYRKLLQATTTATCEDVALQAQIDVTDINFWKSSLDQIAKKVELFIQLTA